ncbi:unnamed protein product [Parajaminaea phylloscopi]
MSNWELHSIATDSGRRRAASVLPLHVETSDASLAAEYRHPATPRPAYTSPTRRPEVGAAAAAAAAVVAVYIAVVVQLSADCTVHQQSSEQSRSSNPLLLPHYRPAL